MESKKESWLELDLESLRKQIITKYGSQTECAKQMGVASQQINRWLKAPSEKFYLLLIKHGLLQGEEYKEEPKGAYIMEELKKIIEEQNKIISDQRNLLNSYSEVFGMLKEARTRYSDKDSKESKEEYLLTGKAGKKK